MRRSRSVAAVAVAASVLVPLVGIVSSAAGRGVDDDAPTLGDREVVASGLDNPRGLTDTEDGDLFLAQAGKGPAEGEDRAPCVASAVGEVCLGSTGRISWIDADDGGEVRDVVTGLPSLAGADGSGALGPSDVSLGERGLHATIGMDQDPAVREAGGALAGTDVTDLLATVQEVERGELLEVADIGDFEARENPDGGELNTNPQALLSERRGDVVVDAGGNSLLFVDDDGDVRTIAAFPTEEGQPQFVPTSVVRGPDGALYLGQLVGFPFPKGAAKVWRIERGGEPEVFASGFTNIIDLAFTEDGDLLVLEIAAEGLTSVPEGQLPAGGLVLVDGDDPDRQHRFTGHDLTAPGGLTVHGDVLYVSNRAVVAGGGEVVSFVLDD